MGSTQAWILVEVTQGASAAAQTSIVGGMDNTALTAAILLVDAAGEAVQTSDAAIQDAIDTGIEIGVNVQPVADAGTDITLKVGETASLDGSGSGDEEDGTALAYAWSFASKPETAQVSLTGAETANASFVPPVAGTYIASLKVTDSTGAVSEAYCTVNALEDSSNVTW